MAYVTPYCEMSFANSVNIASTAWDDADTSDKNMALIYGRLFIDKNYTCVVGDDEDDWDTSDYTTIPDEVQRANAILAEMHISGTLFDTQAISGPITGKKVKAGSAESETTYMGSFATHSKTVDQKPEITMLLSPYCSYGANRFLTRV